ncbi:hypothetical protein BIFDEN_00356 [Bifidobacterium dentium ATCC 27678]|jgi:hypothetical protein|nr:hypothetical protein BIFDEN_00356 [Bifidobacterium dentium ATCC 27678]
MPVVCIGRETATHFINNFMKRNLQNNLKKRIVMGYQAEQSVGHHFQGGKEQS